MPAIDFTPPRPAPARPYGLPAATTWVQATSRAALRWLPAGVQFRVLGPGAFGIWGASWCADPDDLTEADIKTGLPVTDDDPDPFAPMTVWASDRLQQCGNLSEFDRGQARERAEQTFAVREPVALESEFATRLLADAPTPTAVEDLVAAVGHLEEAFAASGTFGLIHARVGLLALAESGRLIIRDPALPTSPGTAGVLRTPGGHRWVFGAGYATILGDTLIGTSPTYGWRDEIEVREAIDPVHNEFIAIAERSVVLGYEELIGAAAVTGVVMAVAWHRLHGQINALTRCRRADRLTPCTR